MLHLLPQDVFLLVLAHLAVDLGVDLVLDLHALDFVGQVHVDLFEALQRVDRFQQFLQVGQRQVDVQRHQVRQAGRVVDVVDHLHDIIRQRLAVGEGYLQQGIQALHQGVGNHVLFDEFPHHFTAGQGDGCRRLCFQNPQAVEPLQGYLEFAIADLLDLVDPAEGADFADLARLVADGPGRPAQNHGHQFVVMVGFGKGLQIAVIDIDREDHIGKGNHVLLDVQRQFFGGCL